MVTFPSFYARFARFVIALLRFCLDENGKLFFARLQFFFLNLIGKYFVYAATMIFLMAIWLKEKIISKSKNFYYLILTKITKLMMIFCVNTLSYSNWVKIFWVKLQSLVSSLRCSRSLGMMFLAHFDKHRLHLNKYFAIMFFFCRTSLLLLPNNEVTQLWQIDIGRLLKKVINRML